MSWHDSQPPVLPYWPTLGKLLLIVVLTTAFTYLLLA